MLREVSAKCGMGTGPLANLENGHRGQSIRVSTIPTLARGYGVSVEEMTAWALHFFAGQPRPSIGLDRSVRLRDVAAALWARGCELGDLTWNPEEPAAFIEHTFGAD